MKYAIILNNAQYGVYFNNGGILQHCVISHKSVSTYHKLVEVNLTKNDKVILRKICKLDLKILREKVKQYE